MDRLTAAKVFIDVTYSGSFTATAERLEMSRPMVTRYIEELEDWLKTRLLHRTTRKISLTTAGESLVSELEQWIQHAAKLEGLSAQTDELSGKVRLTTSVSLGQAKIIYAIQTFMALHPKVDIDIKLQDSAADLVEEQIDLAIRIASKPDESLIGKPIGRCKSVLVALPKYLQETAAIKQPQDLSSHVCLGYKKFDRHIWSLSKGNAFEAVQVHCSLTADEATVLLHAALAGAGIAYLPTYLTEPYISKGELAPVLQEWELPEMKIYVLYSSRMHQSPTIRALIDHFSEILT